MARATLSDIQKVINTSVTDVTFFLDTAHAIVEELVTPAGVHDETRLTAIEVYLSAHLLTVYEPQALQESAGPVSTTYQGKTGYMLHASIHGQMAIMLDTTGALAALQADAMNKDATAKTASLDWIGKSQE